MYFLHTTKCSESEADITLWICPVKSVVNLKHIFIFLQDQNVTPHTPVKLSTKHLYEIYLQIIIGLLLSSNRGV